MHKNKSNCQNIKNWNVLILKSVNFWSNHSSSQIWVEGSGQPDVFLGIGVSAPKGNVLCITFRKRIPQYKKMCLANYLPLPISSFPSNGPEYRTRFPCSASRTLLQQIQFLHFFFVSNLKREYWCGQGKYGHNAGLNSCSQQVVWQNTTICWSAAWKSTWIHYTTYVNKFHPCTFLHYSEIC